MGERGVRGGGEHRTSNIQHRRKKNGCGVDGNALLETVVGAIRESFVERGVEVAHLKVSLEEADEHRTSNGKNAALGAIQWVRSGSEPEFTHRLPGPIRAGRLLLNLRAEAEPEFLSETVARAIKSIGSEIHVRQVAYSAFKPSPPQPTHRIAA